MSKTKKKIRKASKLKNAIAIKKEAKEVKTEVVKKVKKAVKSESKISATEKIRQFKQSVIKTQAEAEKFLADKSFKAKDLKQLDRAVFFLCCESALSNDSETQKIDRSDRIILTVRSLYTTIFKLAKKDFNVNLHQTSSNYFFCKLFGLSCLEDKQGQDVGKFLKSKLFTRSKRLTLESGELVSTKQASNLIAEYKKNRTEYLKTSVVPCAIKSAIHLIEKYNK